MWNRVSWGGPSRLWPWGYFWPHRLTFEVLLSSRVPEFDVPVACSDEVAAIFREGHRCHPTGHLVGGHHNVFLEGKPEEESKFCPLGLRRGGSEDSGRVG